MNEASRDGASPNAAEDATLPPRSPAPPLDPTLPPPTDRPNGNPVAPTMPYVPRAGDTMGPGTSTLRVAGYEVLGELGRGGMGVVYKARDPRLNRLVALKMVLSGGHAGKDELLRFKAEAEAVARLTHPNVVQIYEIGEHDGLPFFALEYVSGGSLAARLDGTPLPAAEAAALVETLARAVHHAHLQGIVHRDLKPANVLLASGGSASGGRKPPDASQSGGLRPPLALEIPKITDFGLAKRLDAETARTAEGSILGTPSYMAPEQAGGKSSDIGPATDVYALGAILYECLTGRPPFRAATALDTVLQVVSDEPVPPTRLQSKVPRDLETICLKCLAKEPHRRYADAEQLADELRRFRAGEPILARPAGSLEKTVKWARRRPAVAALSLGLLLVAAVGFALVTWQWLRAEGERRQAEDARGQERRRAEAEALAKQDAERRKAEAEAARREVEEKQRKLQRLAADLFFDRGLLVCGNGEVSHGLHWFVRALENAPADAVDLRRVLRLNLAAWGGQTHPLRLCTQERGPVLHVALSPDGKSFLAGGPEGGHLWDADTGEPRRTPALDGKGGQVRAVAFSPTGDVLLVGGGDPASPRRAWAARLWDSRSGKSLSLPHTVPVHAAAFSPNGRFVVTGGEKALHVWDASSGEKLKKQPMHSIRGTVRAIVFAPGGASYLVASDRSVQGYETETGKPVLRKPLEHVAPVLAVAVLPGGKGLLTLAEDKVLRQWEGDVSSGQPSKRDRDVVLPHPGLLLAAAFSADGRTVLTAGNDSAARLWDVDSGAPLGAPMAHPASVNSAAVSADGSTLLTGCADGAVRLWGPVPDRGALRSFGHGSAAVWAVAFSPDRKTALTAGHDGTARLWDVSAGKPVGKPLEHKPKVWSAAFSPDGGTVLTGGDDGTVRLWGVATGQEIARPLRHGNLPVRAVAFSPDGRRMLTAGMDGTVRLWRTGAEDPAAVLLCGHDQAVLAAAFSRDGKRVVTGSFDHTAQVWDADTGQPLGQPLRHSGAVYAVAFSPDGAAVLTGGADKAVRRWDFDKGQTVGPPLPHDGHVFSVAFSPDGRLIVSGGLDQTARLWDAATGRPIGPPLRHPREVHAVAFAPDGQRLLTGCLDGAARLWPVPAPPEDEAEHLALRTAVRTGLELTPEGLFRALGADDWRQRREQLEKIQAGKEAGPGE